jgi:hypothetical protein
VDLSTAAAHHHLANKAQEQPSPRTELTHHRTVSTKKKKSLVFFPGVDSAEEKSATSPWKDRDDLDAADHPRITLDTSRVRAYPKCVPIRAVCRANTSATSRPLPPVE